MKPVNEEVEIYGRISGIEGGGRLPFVIGGRGCENIRLIVFQAHWQKKKKKIVEFKKGWSRAFITYTNILVTSA